MKEKLELANEMLASTMLLREQTKSLSTEDDMTVTRALDKADECFRLAALLEEQGRRRLQQAIYILDPPPK